MTTLEGRTKTALLVIDVQNDVVSGAWDRNGVIAASTPSSTRPAPSTCPSSGCSTPTTTCRRAPRAGSTSPS